jgi:hypothetical protein
MNNKLIISNYRNNAVVNWFSKLAIINHEKNKILIDSLFEKRRLLG